MISSAPTILLPWVRIPSTPSTLYSIYVVEKEAGVGPEKEAGVGPEKDDPPFFLTFVCKVDRRKFVKKDVLRERSFIILQLAVVVAMAVGSSVTR